MAGTVKLEAPYSLPSTNNSKLLSILNASSIKASIGRIPLFASIDASETINANTTKLLAKRAAVNRDSSVEDESNLGFVEGENEQPLKYVDIDTMEPKSLKDQVTTVVIQNFPNIKKVAIEKVLDLLIQGEDEKISYAWSLINYDFIDHKLIFVRFDHVKGVQKFVAGYQSGLGAVFDDERVKLVVDPSAEEYVSGSQASEQAGNLKVKVKQIISNKNNFEKASRTGTEDLDQVLNYYSNYKVDNNELIEVPTSMKDSIIKDIVKFRSKVLTIERDNRKKEIELERIKTKERLKRIFEGVKETSDDMEVDSAPERASDVNEYDELNDDDYYKHLQDVESSKAAAEFEQTLVKMKQLEADGAQKSEKLSSLKNYELNLIDNKFKFIEDMKAAAASPNSEKNSFSAISKLYHFDHSHYLKVRSQKRTAEEMLDQQDEEAEKTDDKPPGDNTEVSTAINNTESAQEDTKAKEDTPMDVEEETVELTESPTVIISSLSPETAVELQKKIVELVEEYLGIKDEFLIKVINDSLTAHNLDGKQTLIDELVEILDDDSKNLVDDLWKFILTLDS